MPTTPFMSAAVRGAALAGLLAAALVPAALAQETPPPLSAADAAATMAAGAAAQATALAQAADAAATQAAGAAALATALGGGATGPAATPEAAAPVSRVAAGLANPRGVAWAADGTMYVAQSGTGEDATSTGAAAGVVRIEGGCPVPAGEGLPSSFDPYRDVLGTQDVAFLDGQLYALVATTGALDKMDPGKPNGVYRVNADGTTTPVVDLTTWLNANQVKDPPPDRNSRGEPYRMLPGDGFLWVVDSNSGEVLHVRPDGGVVRVADTSATHLVVTALAPAPTGGVYIGDLTASPHADGDAEAWLVGADGTVTVAWSKLTAVTGLAVAPDGSLWALEMATGNETKDGMRPNTGRLVRQSGPDTLEVVLTGLNYPIDLDIGPDGALYVAGPAYGGKDGSGWLLRVDPDVPAGTAVDPALMDGGDCPAATAAAATPVAGAPAAPTQPPATLPGDAGNEMAATATAAATAAAPAPTPAAGDAAGASASAVAVKIANYAFDPATLEVAAGTTVTWTNDDTVPHTVTASDGSFDSGNLPPGATFSHTFASAGTFDYICSYHAGMKASVVVK